jgi:hypothetical protein
MPRLQDSRRPARGLSPVVHPAMGIATRRERVAQYRPPVQAPRTLRMPDGISRRGPLKFETRVRFPLFDSPWERQRRALLFLPPADSSPIPRGGDSHASDFSNHCRGFVGRVRGDRYFTRTGPTASWKKFMFPRGLRCDMQQARHREKLRPVLREGYGAQRVPLNFALAAWGAGCLSAGAGIVSGRCPWFLAKWFHAD